MKKKKEKIKVSQMLAKTLEISKDLLTDIPRFSLNDNNELQIENYKGIVSYDFDEIKLGAKNYTIKIEGENLKINSITDEDILITGTIKSLSFG
ncbi:MAG: sporulation protein YqfC [Clostridia bacterium]|nr:sporulation protein YqfC [Clostridia bacterium]